MKVGDIVKYIDDWKPNREWKIIAMHDNNLCSIALIRNGKHTTIKQFGNFSEKYTNASIVNLPIEKIIKF